ncbi:MAG: relaxase, partial [Clostridia bacterium]|nr:relaxase [Clostridia bacterium]
MAITKVHPIKSTLNLAIGYITNEEKTDEQILISEH